MGDGMKQCIVSTTIVLDREHKRTILVKHKKLGVWLPPGGHIEEGELPHEAALREAKEETGLDIRLLNPGGVVIQTDEHVTQAVAPFVVLHEHVIYKTQPDHMHYDLVYVADTDSSSFSISHEATDIGWFDRKSLESLEMFTNVRSVLNVAFDEFGPKK